MTPSVSLCTTLQDIVGIVKVTCELLVCHQQSSQPLSRLSFPALNLYLSFGLLVEACGMTASSVPIDCIVMMLYN